MHKPQFADAITNFTHLRQRAIEKMYLEPHATWSAEEDRAIMTILKEEIADWRQSGRLSSGDWSEIETVRLVHRDLYELGALLPKWGMLAAWLAPEYALAHQPWVIEAIAKLVLPPPSEQETSP